MQKRNFSILDGLRGICALVVVFYHIETAQYSKNAIFGSGYLAVDLFFLMSGFVVAHAYEERLLGGMKISNFISNRAIRLYPTYMLSTFIGLALAVLASFLAGDAERMDEAFISLPFALLAIPHLSADGLTWFPLAPPAWSLFYEVILNVVYAMLVRHLPVQRLAFVSASSLILLGMYVTSNGSVDGAGAIRSVFGISSGVLLYRIWNAGYFRDKHYPIYLPLILTLLALVLPSEGGWGTVTIPLCLGIVFPGIILLSVQREPSQRSVEVFEYLGAISYPIYLLHWPILLAVRKAATISHISLVQQVILTMSATIVISAIALKFYDEPLRKILTNRKRIKERCA